MSTANRLAIVTVLEPGGALEAQVLLLSESLRAWGGRLAGAPIVCVSPRLHPPIRRSMRARLDELGIVHVDRDRHHRFSWYGFLNKAMAMAEAREATDAEHLAWLDADTLILDEPDAFLSAAEDFSALLTGGDLSTAGPSDPHEAFWEAACLRLGLDLEAMPWVEADGRRVRYCIQAGVFRVRRASPMIAHYLANLESLMDARVFPSSRGLFFHETTALTLAPFTSGSSWSELPRSHNFVISAPPGCDDVEGLESARVLHYQHRLYPPHRRDLLAALRRRRPDRADWLEGRLPAFDASSRPSPPGRLLARGLQAIRRRKAIHFLAGCRPVGAGPLAREFVGR